MKITDFSIKNPTTIIIFSILIFIMGLKTYIELPRESSPDITVPYIIITTPYIGVAPSDIETLITSKIEKKLKEISEIKELTSTSAESASMIVCEFNSGIDIDYALQKVRDKVDLAKPDIPVDAEESTITEINISEFPVFSFTLSGNYTILQLKEIADDLEDKLDTIPGVLDVNIFGGLTREISIEPDPEKLKHYGISLSDFIMAIQVENLNIPGGKLKVGTNQFLLRVPGEFKDVNEIKDIVVRNKRGNLIYIRDIANVIDGYEDRETISRINGKPSITVKLQKRSGENIIRIVNEAKEKIEKFQKTAPKGLVYTVTLDYSQDIKVMVDDLENNMITALILVLAILFVALSFKTAVLVSTAIPFSLMLTFISLKAFDITLNMIVLFSLVLVLGRLVDDAIVVVENIYRHLQEGEDSLNAAIHGTKEVAWPVTTSTLATISAFVPMLFWPGIIGEFMGFLPKTVIIALFASLFVALTINPVLCSLFLNVKSSHKKENRKPSKFMEKYKQLLHFVIKHRYLTMVSVFGLLILTAMIYGQLHMGVVFFPESDPKRITIKGTAPDGTRLEETDKITQVIEKHLATLDNIKYYVADVGSAGGGGMSSGSTASNKFTISVEYTDRRLRKENTFVTTGKIRKILKDVSGADIEIEKETEGPPKGAPISIEVSGSDFAILGQLSDEVERLIKNIPNLVDLKDNYSTGLPEIRIIIDREKARLFKINTQSIANTIRIAFNGGKAGVFRENDDEYDIVVKFPEKNRLSLIDIENLYINGDEDAQIPLSHVAKIETTGGFGSIRRVDENRTVTITANVQGRTSNAVLQDITKILDSKLKLPPEYTIRYTGEQEDQNEAASFLSWAFMIAFFLITMVLVAEFNSVTLPFIIMFSVILSLIGVLIGLIVTKQPFGIIMTGIGVISLAGVVVTNAIVLIDYIQHQRKLGVPKIDAVVKAGIVRFRPVFLTASATVLGLLPLVLGFNLDLRNMMIDVGAETVTFWRPMATAVVFGLTFATILTLLVVPTMYVILTDWSDRLKEMLGKKTTKFVEIPQTTKVDEIIQETTTIDLTKK